MLDVLHEEGLAIGSIGVIVDLCKKQVITVQQAREELESQVKSGEIPEDMLANALAQLPKQD